VKKIALIAALLAVFAMLGLAGCKDETMLDNYSSDTFELGGEDPLAVDSIEDLF